MPELPPHFLPRPVEIDFLNQQILRNAKQRVVVTSTSRRVGVQGMGGIGKSVLAAALARSEQVRQAFPDGVVWVSVSQTPQLLAWQSYLAKLLGDTQPGFTEVELGKARLRELLKDQACLLIIDDVWQAKQAAAFDVLGDRTGMLITTRDAGLVSACGAIGYELQVRSARQALALLAEWADQPVATLPANIIEVAGECGNLPLALAIIGAIGRGNPKRWDKVLPKLRLAK